MNTFDEETLQRALREAADGFVVSSDAVNRILDESRESPAPVKQRRFHDFVGRSGRVRASMMAAAACVVALAAAVPLVLAESPAAVPSAVGAHRSSVHTNALTVSGTGFTSGAVVPVSEQKGFGVAGSVTNTKLSVSEPSEKSSTSAGSEASQSSLRVEEVGTIRLSVGGAKFQSTLTQLTDFATTDGGLVQSTQSHMGSKANHSYSTGTIVLQVPERNFTMLVDQVRHAGVATSVVTSANDVTGQYVDLQARISALQVSRTQYLKIMTRTGTINGILEVQNQLNQIQSQIEQLQAQLGLLNSETTYATLTVNLSEAGHQVVPTTHARSGVDKAWHDSLHGFATGVEWLIRLAGPLLFMLLLVAVLLVIGRWGWRVTERRRDRIS
ncbi:MAG: DUF4349 domain-containing protein [Acidimicrobiales bacterium]